MRTAKNYVWSYKQETLVKTHIKRRFFKDEQ